MNDIKINFCIDSINRFAQGTKRVVVHNKYNGNKRVLEVFYYDTNFDKISFSIGCCCHAPSRCKDEASAERMIKRFFSSPNWHQF